MIESEPRVAVQSLLAAKIAEHLVGADLCGMYSHSIFRLPRHSERVQWQ